MIYCLKYSTTTTYFKWYILCMLVPHVFEFSYGKIMVRILITTSFWASVPIKARRLLEADVYFDLNVKRGSAYYNEVLILDPMLKREDKISVIY